MLESPLLNSWSATQKNVMLLSAEAELVAAVEVCGGCIGITQRTDDWGIELCGRVHIDSSAAIGSEPPGQREASPCACGNFVETGVRRDWRD